MGWETRSNNSYYYRKVRSGHKVVSKYCGSDMFALVAEAQDVAKNANRMNERLEALKQKQHLEELRKSTRSIEDIEEVIRAIYQGVLLASGYHTHSRQWRKIRCLPQ